MSKPTYEDVATNWELWCEYVDPHATMTREEFYRMTTEEKVQMQVDIWGKEETEDDE